MPAFEKLLESIQKRLKEEGFERPSVTAGTFNVTQGVIHGSLQAIACGLLNPLDKKNAKISIENLADNKLKSTSSGVSKLATTGFKQRVKGYFPEQPWAGTLYTIRINVPRNILVFTLLPLIKDQLTLPSPLHRDVVAGVGAGLAEAVVTSRSRAIQIYHRLHPINPSMRTSPTLLWQGLSAKSRSDMVKSSFKWSTVMCSVYWATFPAFTTFFESQFKQLMDKHNIKDSLTAEAMEYAASGALAGTLTPIITYPIYLMSIRALNNPQENQIQKTWIHYCKNGLLNTVKNHTHNGFISVSLPRMMISSAFFNLNLHAAKAACNLIFKKEETTTPAPSDCRI